MQLVGTIIWKGGGVPTTNETYIKKSCLALKMAIIKTYLTIK
jgi:hypothetical protein